MATQKNSQNPEPGILNVLLHGAFTFVHDDVKQEIHALMPTLDQHAYRAGSFLAETELVGGNGEVYKLNGVRTGKEHDFDPDKNLQVKVNGERPKALPYATVILPWADRIESLRVVDVPTKYFTNPGALVVKGDTQHMGTLQVFTYEIENEKELSLKAVPGKTEDQGEKGRITEKHDPIEGHYWEPAFTGNHVNLHIFCAEDHYHKPSNASQDFDSCVDLLGVDLKLDARFLPAKVAILNTGPLPDGVVPQETEALAVRTQRLARLGRLIVLEGDANLVWREPDALDGDPTACGPVTD